MKPIRLICVGLTAAMLFSLTGCLKFRDSFDLIYSTTGTPVLTTEEPSTAPEPVLSEPEQTTGEASATEADVTDGPTDAPSETPTDTAPTDTDTTAVPAVPTVPANNEYDILRSGSFSMKATMMDDRSENTVDMSVGENGSLYMNADMDGLEMGILVQNKRTYLVYPPEKKYLKLNGIVTTLLKLDPSEFTDMASQMGFDSMKPLSDADSVTDGVYRGTSCKIYHIPYEDGTFANVYMNGSKLLGIENLSAAGLVDATMIISSVTAGFPQMPPADYSESGYLEFFRIISENME